ncbi:MAG: glycosyltransferase [Clostridia bacterium]|nr:glycosyltransferase [Clostridia bacterium]
MMPLISVIVPIYKVEEYLDKCLESILAQTYKNLEIILADDGSPDNCPKICDEYAAKDERIRVIHKENGGLSDARNAGLEIATGDYIAFVDSDDYILPDMYEKLYKAIEENKADMSICNYVKVDESGKVISQNEKAFIKKGVLTPSEAMAILLENQGGGYIVAWNKLYKREIFKELRFEKGRLHEDEFFIHHAYGKCRKIACIEDGLYMYLQRGASITGSTANIRRLDVGLAMLDRYRFFKESYPALAKEQAVKAYAGAIAALNRATFRKLPKDYQMLVDDVLRLLYKEKDLRYIKLLIKKICR